MKTIWNVNVCLMNGTVTMRTITYTFTTQALAKRFAEFAKNDLFKIQDKFVSGVIVRDPVKGELYNDLDLDRMMKKNNS